MSCDRRCFEVGNPFEGHDDCATCPGQDSGPRGKVEAPEFNDRCVEEAAEISQEAWDSLGNTSGENDGGQKG
jgi:hypothetical protein